MYVASKLGHLLWFPIGGPLSASFSLLWWKLGVQYLFRYSAGWHASDMSGPAQIRPDNVCLNASCVYLFDDVSVGYPILPVDTENSSEYALLELFELFNMATIGDPCLTAI